MLYYKKKNCMIVTVAVIMAAVCLLLRLGRDNSAFSAGYGKEIATLVIDAGHGGQDGGTTGRSGTVEKDINLKIAMYIREFCDYLGLVNVMTRDSDISLHNKGTTTIRKQKIEDMKKRLEITLEQTNPIYIGIHQNYFGDFVSSGAQTFYSESNPNSKLFAELLLTNIKSIVDPDNKRKAAKIQASNYILKNLNCPAVIVECGFLSNPEEEMLLCSPLYQQKLAYTITISAFYMVTNGSE